MIFWYSYTKAIDFRFLTKFMKKYIKPDDKIIDLGCGDGTFLYEVQKKFKNKIIGCDINEQSLEKAKEKKLECFKNKIDTISLTSNSIDCVISNSVIEHFKHPKEMLKEVYRVLKPDGLFILTTDNEPKCISREKIELKKKAHQIENFFNHYYFIENTDFTVIDYIYYNSGIMANINYFLTSELIVAKLKFGLGSKLHKLISPVLYSLPCGITKDKTNSMSMAIVLKKQNRRKLENAKRK